MKNSLFGFLVLALLMSSCMTSKNAGAVMTGAAIGNNVGSAVGGLIGHSGRGWHSNYRGSAIGSIVGTVAGAVIAHEITKPRQEESYEMKETTRRPAASQVERLENPGITIRNIRFIDEGRNQTINSGETCRIIFEIHNDGKKSIHNLVPIVKEVSDMKRIDISPSVMIERLAPGEGLKYTATLIAGNRIKTGNAVIHVGVANEYGNEYDWREFDIPTSKR